MRTIKIFFGNYPNFKQFIKFCIVGGTSAIINFTIFLFLTHVFDIWYVYSSIPAFLISAIFNFISNKFWTFRNILRGSELINQIGRFIFVMVTGTVINTSIIFVLTETINFDYRLSWVGATGAVTFWNYFFNRFWTFKYKYDHAALSQK